MIRRRRKTVRIHPAPLLAVLVLLAAAAAGIFFRPRGADALSILHAGEPTLVIDAGHGGIDGGAVGSSGVLEKTVNLAVAQRAQALFRFLGARTVMPREEDTLVGYREGRPIRENKNADLHGRITLLGEIEDPILLSIHQNQFEQEKYYGAQVFFGTTDKRSEALAKAMQEALRAGLDPENGRVATPAGKNIYLLYHAKCPAVIVECGFLSNAREDALLNTPDYQKQIVAAMAAGYYTYRNGEAN